MATEYETPQPGAAGESVNTPSMDDATTVSPYEQQRARYSRIPPGQKAEGDLYTSVIVSLSTLDSNHEDYYPLCEYVATLFLGQTAASIAAAAEQARQKAIEQSIEEIIATLNKATKPDVLTDLVRRISTMRQQIKELAYLKQIAAATGTPITTLKADLKLAKAESSKLMAEAQAQTNATARPQRYTDYYDDFPGHPDIMIPQPYRLIPSSGRISMVGTNMELVAVSPLPIAVIRRMRDADTSEMLLTVAVRDRGRWTQVTEPRAKFFGKSSLVDLASRGMPFSDTTARAGTRFLADAEVANSDVLPEMIGVTSLGWRTLNSERMFALGGQIMRRAEAEGTAPIEVYAPDAGEQQILDGFQTGGTFEGWCEMAAMCLSYPKLMLGMYASLAAPLLQMTSLQGAMIHYCGRTSKGKTTALQIGASVWGYPGGPQLSQHPGMIRSWNGTAAANERLLAFLRHLPVYFDDISLADPHIAADTVYACVNGQGRRRSNVGRGTRSTGSWNLIALSTGEHSIRDITTAGGVQVRAIDMWGDVFGDFSVEGGDGQYTTVGEDPDEEYRRATLAQRLRRQTGEHYGHAGERMVRALLMHDPIQLRAAAQREMDRLVETVGAPARTDMGGRLAQAYGVMAVAAIILHTELVPADSPLAQMTAHDVRAFFARALEAQLTGADAPQHADVAAYEAALGWVHAHAHQFVGGPGADTDHPPATGWLGRWRVPGLRHVPPGEYVAIHTGPLRQILEQSHHDYDAVTRAWAETGRSVGDGHGKATRPVDPMGSDPQDRSLVRMVVLRLPPATCEDAVSKPAHAVEEVGQQNMF